MPTMQPLRDDGLDVSCEPSVLQPMKITTENYQDEDSSKDSQLKTIWDGTMCDMKNTAGISYKKAVVLLLSWKDSLDDLHTAKEVCRIQNQALSLD